MASPWMDASQTKTVGLMSRSRSRRVGWILVGTTTAVATTLTSGEQQLTHAPTDLGHSRREGNEGEDGRDDRDLGEGVPEHGAAFYHDCRKGKQTILVRRFGELAWSIEAVVRGREVP
jgi:hypothetical protein